MVGVILKFDNWSKNIFKILFNDIDISLWNFDIKYWESYGESTMTKDYNNLDHIDSEDAKKELIYNECEVYPEFLELFISEFSTKKCDLKYYDDFIKSDYFMSLVIIDHRNIEICCKDIQVLEKIIKNFKESNLENKRVNVLEKIRLDAVISAFRLKSEINIYDI